MRSDTKRRFSAAAVLCGVVVSACVTRRVEPGVPSAPPSGDLAGFVQVIELPTGPSVLVSTAKQDVVIVGPCEAVLRLRTGQPVELLGRLEPGEASNALRLVATAYRTPEMQRYAECASRGD